jgi:hypothetical protein
MTTFKHLDVVSRVERPQLTPETAAHAQRVRERNDWLQRGSTGKAPKAIYGGRS